MVRKLARRKVVSGRRPLQITKEKIILPSGKATGAMLLILLVVGFVAAALGFGDLNFSRYGDETLPGYTCCDSGNGDACRPNTEKTISYNGDTYALLKSNVRPYDPVGTHFEIPTAATDLITADGERIILNTSDHSAPDYPPSCIHDPNNPQDFVSEIVPGVFVQGAPAAVCFPIPNDIIIYTCRKDNEPGACDGEFGKGRFDAYFRINRDEEIPLKIRNCVIPPIPSGAQKMVGLPSNTQRRDDLQIETFFIDNDAPYASWITPYCKPAIYLYPPEETLVHVTLNPNLKLTYTDPLYPSSGWFVWAYPDGTIVFDNKNYDYLYYEAEIREGSYTVPEEGFVVEERELRTFLPDLVTRLGLNGKEAAAFSDYWVNVLPSAPYYQIKIISQPVLDSIAPLSIVPTPATVIRVTLHFTTLEEKRTLPAPEIIPVYRDGFTVIEWGGLFQYDPKRPFSCLM